MSVSSINHNLSFTLAKLMERLSSGKRINSAADDAAGLAIGQKMSANISALSQGTNNLRNMDSYIRTADGALGSITSMLQDANASYVRMNNGIYTQQDKATLQLRIDNLASAIEGVTQQASFNGLSVFSDDALQANAGTSSSDVMSVMIGEVSVDLSSQEATYDSLKSVLSQLGVVGAAENAMQHSISVNEISEIEAASSLSQIEDGDMAELISEYKSKSTLQQLVYSMMRTKNENEQGVLRLFQ